jgi:anti-anti-sigma regulatory factor
MSLPSTLTQAQAASVAGHLEKAIAGSQGVFLLDTSALQQFDSSALAVLVGACRAAARRGEGSSPARQSRSGRQTSG